MGLWELHSKKQNPKTTVKPREVSFSPGRPNNSKVFISGDQEVKGFHPELDSPIVGEAWLWFLENETELNIW